MKVGENDFTVITADEVSLEDVITAIVISTDIWDEMTSNAFVQMLLPFDKESRISDK